MLVSFSFVDVLKIPEIAKIADSPFDLLRREMDNIVAPYLFLLGANIDHGLKIQACRHRTVDLKSVVSYRYVCLERSDKEWLADPRCSMSARIHAQKDPELASDMVRMSAEGMGESGFRAMCMANFGKEGTTRSTKKDEEEGWEDDYRTMAVLRSIQEDVRGWLHPDEDMIISDDLVTNIINFNNEEGETNEQQ